MSDLRTIIEHQDYRVIATQAGLDIAVADTLIADYLHQAVPHEYPFIIHTLGIPGAGKSTYINKLDTSDMVVISFDSIMEAIPGYKQDKQSHGVAYAFEKWELCAREIGYELLFRATETKRNIIFEHSGSRADHASFLKALKQDHAYQIRIMFFSISEELALARAAKRERYLPPHYIPERRQKVEALLPSYQAIADEYTEFMAPPPGKKASTA